MNKRQFTLWSANLIMQGIASRKSLGNIFTETGVVRSCFNLADEMTKEAEKRGLFEMLEK